jgi:deoxycytidine triphosphate deaminase
VITSVLSDGTIKRLVQEGRLKVEPWDPAMVQPASIDLNLGSSFRVFHNHRLPAIDLAAPPKDVTEHVRTAEGQSFVIHPGEFVLGSTAEWVELPQDLVARIEGKALALDTPVPTPAGWRTMGELEIGDEVFDVGGDPTLVVDATEPLVGRPCRELVFADGTTIVADLTHQWMVATRTDGRRQPAGRILTTEQIERALRQGGEHNHVPLAPAVAYAERDLPVDPYVLGAWIGDGAGTKAEASGVDDASRPRDLGLLGRKRIPRDYLGSSAEQYRELIASLGHRPVIATKTATLHGRLCGLRYEVEFTPERPVFRLPRELARQKHSGGWHRSRAIVDVRPVDSVPVRCIQVASPDGMYLVSRSFIPTHNSSLGRLGLIVHATAGFVDPGFKGTLTLEITNLTRVPIVLWPGKPIAQLSFMALDRPAERPYGHPDLGSHYHGQSEATESRYEGGGGRSR